MQRHRLKRPPPPSVTAADKDIWALLDEAELTDHISFMMRLAQMALLEQAFARQKSIDLSLSQLTILRLIHTRPGLTQQRIADAMRIKKTNLTPLINELVADGFVTRKHSLLNRKAYALQLTRKGTQSFKKARKIMSSQMCSTENILEPQEREQLIRSLRKIILSLPPHSDRGKRNNANGR
jgi:DNA-binding MarR family transcriptional regulator